MNALRPCPRRPLLLVLGLALVPALLHAQPAPPAGTAAVRVDAARLLAHVRVLAADSMAGRAVGSPGNALARAYILGEFAAIGLRPFGEGYEHAFTFENRRGATLRGVNVVGYVEGAAHPDSFLVLTAHYDHLGERDGAIYNGADDNASGTAALLELARAFAADPPAHSVVFAALDAEEGGLRGARAFVADPPVPLGAVKLNINLDMVSRSERGELYAAGTYHYPRLRTHLEPLAPEAPVSLLFGHDRPDLPPGDDWTNASDHAPFHAAGIPFVYFGVEDHPGYHQPSDTFDAITPDFFVRAVETIRRAARTLDEGL